MTTPILPPVKRCSKCGEEKPATVEYFYSSKNRLFSQCRECVKIASRNRYHVPEIKARVLSQHHTDEGRQQAASTARARRLNPDHRNKINERNRAIYNSDPNKRQRILNYMADRYRRIYPHGSRPGRSKMPIEEKRRRWKASSLIYRLRKQALPKTFTSESERILKDYFNHSCAICGCIAREGRVLVCDHWIPLSHPECPGTVPENMMLLCHSTAGDKGGCNSVKRHLPPNVWVRKAFPDSADEILARINAYFEYLRNA